VSALADPDATAGGVELPAGWRLHRRAQGAGHAEHGCAVGAGVPAGLVGQPVPGQSRALAGVERFHVESWTELGLAGLALLPTPVLVLKNWIVAHGSGRRPTSRNPAL